MVTSKRATVQWKSSSNGALSCLEFSSLPSGSLSPGALGNSTGITLDLMNLADYKDYKSTWDMALGKRGAASAECLRMRAVVAPH